MINNNQLIICIDGGDKYVGVFSYYNGATYYTQLIRKENIYDDLKFISNELDKIVEMFSQAQTKLFIIEKYLNYTHKVSIKGWKENKTSEFNGIIQQYAINNGFEIKTQAASQAKFWGDDRLVRLGLLDRLGNKLLLNNQVIQRHTRDAYRHFIYYTNKTWFDSKITKEKLYS